MMKILFIAFMATISIVANAQTTEYNTNRGFIHPGGLHTQADFDRVKAQLAANNTKVKQAYAKLTSAAYSQANVQTYPSEVIVRGGGNGENYINACRGAAMAYQNALRWKIAGTKANAEAAVRILMAWANTTKDVSGDSNYALASGLYGYQFAQAAELMRDYEGWKAEDFKLFQQWMLTVWYPKAIGFLRGRNGTWENAGKWWKAPGHYWSNWGLCNAMCVALIGILCDDVYIYNQGMSYYKYDQCATFQEPRTEVPIKNDGLTEFLGNLVVTTYTSELETGAYGMLGQMNESGRDTGHSAMALGLAVDMAKIGWSQGDDLFAYMDHRLAAGIEYVAAQTQSVENLPWVNYIYGSSGYYYSDSRAWLMTAPAMGAQTRPYWGTVIGIYEGVKGVKMPFSEVSYNNMGIDEGGQGSTSGGYDHLGYSVLMNTRDEQLCPAEKTPTELTPKIEYSGTLTTNLIPSLALERTRGMVNGKVISHNEMGGIVNTYSINNNTCVPKGQTLKLMPQLPEGEEDTGIWRWETGETTRDITVSSDSSYIYRVTYTNKNGIESELCFPIASNADCRPDQLVTTITNNNVVTNGTTARVLYGKTVKLSASSPIGFGTWKWTGNKTTQEITTTALRNATDYKLEYTNQGGAVTSVNFHLDVLAASPYAMVDSVSTSLTEESATLVANKFLALNTAVCAKAGSKVTLGLTLPSAVKASGVIWEDGTTGNELVISGIQQSKTFVAKFSLAGEEVEMRFNVMLIAEEASVIEAGTYRMRHVASDTYLTTQEKNKAATFEPLRDNDASQIWFVDHNATPKYTFTSLSNSDSLQINASGRVVSSAFYPLFIDQAVGTDRIAIHTSATSPKYWDVTEDGLETASATSLLYFPFQLIAVGTEDGVQSPIATSDEHTGNENVFDLSGRNMTGRRLTKGVYVSKNRKILVK
ncbi:MAG: alginate lyase family protein [Bacteroidaceae bacterium]|nr:alginate lyase family protein [Bacteroidaceae bacterium]